ncbi:MAG: SMC-Scp complex subunit ScpB [Planctomycetaceae bacterium]
MIRPVSELLSPRRAWPAVPSPGSMSELQLSRWRQGDLFQFLDSVDQSQTTSEGRLIRSVRLAKLEAVLLISRSAVPAKKLSQLAGLVDGAEAEQLVETLNRSYDLTGSAFRIEQTATGYLMMTRPALVSWLDRLHERQAQMTLSQPMMETLTIIAYQQPVTRADVEAVRGVQSTEMIRQLIDRGLVKVGGEDDSLGRPFLYITTRSFLDMFGLERITDLPDYDSIGRQTKIAPTLFTDEPQNDDQQAA